MFARETGSTFTTLSGLDVFRSGISTLVGGCSFMLALRFESKNRAKVASFKSHQWCDLKATLIRQRCMVRHHTALPYS